MNVNRPAAGSHRLQGAGPSAVPLATPADFEQWAEAVRPRLIRLAYRYLWNVHDAEEVTQEAMALACREKSRTGGSDRGDAWVCRVVINLSLNRLRRTRSRRLPSGELPDRTAPGETSAAELDELTQRLRWAIRDLPERQQAAIVLRDLEGMPYAEVATVLQIREAAARLLVHRAREGVRQMLLSRWPDSFGHA